MLRTVKRYIALIHSGEALPLAEKHCRPQDELANAQLKNGCGLLLGGVIIPWLLFDSLNGFSYAALFTGLLGCTIGSINKMRTESIPDRQMNY